MKFAFLSSYAHRALQAEPSGVSGGAELQVALLSRELAARGHEVVVIGADDSKVDGNKYDGVEIRIGGRYQTGGFFDTMTSLPRVFTILRQERPQILGIMGAGSWVFFLHLFRKLLDYKLVFVSGSDIDVDGSYRKLNPIKGRLYEFALKRADVRFAMTEFQRSRFKAGGLSCGLYRNLLPPGVTDAPSAKSIDFLWVSSAQALKRPFLFLDLAKRFPQHTFEMICPLKSDRKLWESVRDQALRITNLRFHDWVAYNRVQTVFDQARVFVNTSIYEGFPNTFVQAGLGRVAILSLSVDPDNFITSTGAGICAHGDLEMFWNGAQIIMNDLESLQKMQRHAAHYIREFHDTSRNVDAFLEEFQ